VRIKPALFTLGIFEAVEFDGTLPYPDRAEAADPAPALTTGKVILLLFRSIFGS